MQDLARFLNHYVLPTESVQELIFTFSLDDVPVPDDKHDYFLFVEGVWVHATAATVRAEIAKYPTNDMLFPFWNCYVAEQVQPYVDFERGFKTASQNQRG